MKKNFFVDTLKFPETKLSQLGLKISAGFSYSILNFQWRVSKIFVRIKEVVTLHMKYESEDKILYALPFVNS